MKKLIITGGSGFIGTNMVEFYLDKGIEILIDAFETASKKNNNLKFYESIIPCGIIDRGIINIKSINKKNYKDINKVIIKNFNYFFK